MRVIAVIPCYNEAEHIADVVGRCSKYIYPILVCDDNSTDGTVQKALDKGAIIVNKTNGGKGAGLSTYEGMRVARAMDCSAVVTLDGDGQHNPDEIPLLLKPIEEGIADIAIGSRFMDKAQLPIYRRFGISVITWLYNVFSKQKTTDAQCCFRAYSRDVIDNIKITEAGFPFSVEVLIKARTLGYRIVDVPVTCIYHDDFNMNSSMNPIKHGVIVALAVLKWRFRCEVMKRKGKSYDKVAGNRSMAKIQNTD